MGSGRGQARRTQKPFMQIPTRPTQEMPKWGEFVKTSGLEKTRVFAYYLNDAHTQGHAYFEREKLTTELFQDAVSVGAITLPPPYKVDDFEFRVEHGKGLRTIGSDAFLKTQPRLDRRGISPIQYSLLPSY